MSAPFFSARRLAATVMMVGHLVSFAMFIPTWILCWLSCAVVLVLPESKRIQTPIGPHMLKILRGPWELLEPLQKLAAEQRATREAERLDRLRNPGKYTEKPEAPAPGCECEICRD